MFHGIRHGTGATIHPTGVHGVRFTGITIMAIIPIGITTIMVIIAHGTHTAIPTGTIIIIKRIVLIPIRCTSVGKADRIKVRTQDLI